jgi:hypothetical protein
MFLEPCWLAVHGTVGLQGIGLVSLLPLLLYIHIGSVSVLVCRLDFKSTNVLIINNIYR